MIIAEDLLLLTYDDESGSADPWIDNLAYRLAGALLVELALTGRVEPTDERTVDPDGKTVRRGRIVVRDGSPTGHAELDTALASIAGRPRRPGDLIEPLSRGLQKRLLAGLADRGVLRREQGRILGIFPMTRWPAVDSAHETALRGRLGSVLLDGATPAPHDAALLALAKGTRLVRRLVPKDRRTEAEARAKQVAESGWVTDATTKAIEEAVAAAMVAIM
ncbi:GOLPH3/VPS74 family protein [Xylanimonas sp. McL0601]|uniref:GOLPH3/VPS74 family protein n=1 Tax=Xylanimonas sp. McL0601 TaxID=3414739 RepID=UPI003CF9EBC6